jgi:hypothetical protein
MIYFFRLLVHEQPFPFGQFGNIIFTQALPALIDRQRGGGGKYCARVFAG